MAIADDAIEVTDFTSPVSLRLLSGGRDILTIRVIAATAGASIAFRTKGSGTTNRTLAVAAGEEIPLNATSIESVTNVTRVRVYWHSS